MRTKQENGTEVDEWALMEGLISLATNTHGSQIFTANCLDGSTHHFHIDRGLRLAANETTLFTISLADCGLTKARVLSQYDGLDQAYALTTDLNKPLLFVPRPDKPDESILVDGWHRVWKALETGQDEMFAYFLDADLADRITVMIVPPGVEPPTL